MNTLFTSINSWIPFILRLGLGIVILPHGCQKLLGWFGGYGFNGTMDYFTGTMNLPWIIGFLVIILEVFGVIFLIAGFFTRLWAFSLTVLAIGIILSSHIPHGFFMNWYGEQSGEGYEYFILWITISIALTVTGGGKFSLDNKLIIKQPEN
ncbi:DoxX family protein [Zunongwangia sp. F363]|uniref:DoxX family protein n=1 Tax=Autumnicola tepida TaxID=3075595 RepID=A0ABU3CF08_9FLAO|nr:DoxX family protein [Zunongwangia sp. F363]MDT0644833.1 DoxX family protein [Zunongwangia sp. F363]